MKDNTFFIIVVGDVRDKNGNYRRLLAITQNIMENLGLRLYNDVVYLTPLGSASMRANGQFEASRKVCNTHQYFQVYLKGDIKKTMNKVKNPYGGD